MTRSTLAELALTRHADGTVTLDGPPPDRIAIQGDVLEQLDPAVGLVDHSGTLTVLGHRYTLADYHFQIDVYEFARADA